MKGWSGQDRRDRREVANAAVLVAVLSLASLWAFPVLAFDSEEWHGKREVFAREAERLRAAYSNCVARLETPAEDVTVPVETFDDGSVRTVVSAKKVQYFFDKGLVWAHGVVVRKLKQDGTVEARVEAKDCVIDRATKSGWAEGAATVMQGGTVFRGRGVYFNSPESYVRVFESSEVKSKDLKFGEVRP